jgi:hypothetical protein
MSTRSIVFGTILLLLGSISALHATPTGPEDTVIFKNGDVLTGKVVRATAAAVTFSSDRVGDVTLKWSDLETVTVRHPVRIITPGSSQSFDSPTLRVIGTAAHLELEAKERGGGSPVDLQDVEALTGSDRCASGIQEACPGWQLKSVSVNLSYLGTTQTDQTYGGSVESTRNWNPEDEGWPHQRTLLDLQANYDDKRKNSKPGSANITQEYDGRLQHLFFITSDAFYASTVADFYHNNSLGLFLEQSYGGGVGRLWHGTEFDADLRFIGEHFYGPNPSVSLAGSQLSERRTFYLNWIRSGANIVEEAKYTPVFNMGSAWQLYGRADLSIPINKKLQAKFGVADNYVENAPAPYRKNYLKTTMGLTYAPNPKH